MQKKTRQPVNQFLALSIIEGLIVAVVLLLIPADPKMADEGFLRMEGETEMWVEFEFDLGGRRVEHGHNEGRLLHQL